ncbi:MAG: HlyD family secretion protein [Bryobacterales bacterium]|nr:HlyD family secretion protein [Bryobacterales bacterium]
MKNKRFLLIGLIFVAVLIAIWYFWHSRFYESTDNAFIDADILQISPRVPGQVLRVLIQDNQRVKEGDLLVEIDPGDYEARLAEAQGRLKDVMAKAAGAESNLGLTSAVTGAALQQAGAAVAAAQDQLGVLQARLAQDDAVIHAAQAGFAQAEARRTAAEAEAVRAGTDAQRYRELYKKDEVSKQLLDRSEAEARATAANAEAARQVVAAAQAQLTQAKAARGTTEASLLVARKQVEQAEARQKEAQAGPKQVSAREADLRALRAQVAQQTAAVRLAELNLSYTRVLAPDSGYVTRKSVQPGNYVQTGQALMALVSDRAWVVANFKETQLTHMRPGQRVDLKIDAYPDRKLQGRVDSIQAGSGARFSLLPPENATGNYVKVVQRVPVKIVFVEPPPGNLKIGPGMSVVPTVWVQ